VTTSETIRFACYVIASLAMMYKALSMIHQRRYGGAFLRLFLTALFVWYMAEVTMIGQGINTRDLRIIGTPMIMGITIVAVAQAIEVWRHQHKWTED
jgi:hypothetical protein